MRRRKGLYFGFTLIELLAIIVILAVIAVITVPVILNIIESSKRGAAIDSVYGYIKSVNNFYMQRLYHDKNFDLQGDYVVNGDGSITNADSTYLIGFSGGSPESGYLTIENGYPKDGCVVVDGYAVTFSNGIVKSASKGTCSGGPQIVDVTTVTDSNPGIICGTLAVEDYENSDVCYIYSVEDLVDFSNLVNDGKNFSGKKVLLMSSLDVKDIRSYADYTTTAFGDVNGDSNISSLFDELTTGSGFKPIGSSSKKFVGVFEGYGNSISNILINYPNIDNVGLFGYNTGTIKGVNVKNASVSGLNNVGVLAGYSSGSITSVAVSGDVSGTDYLGLVTGKCSYPDSINIEAVVSGNVTGTGSNVGSVVGFVAGSSSISAVNLGGQTSIASSKIYGDKSNNTSVNTTYVSDTVSSSYLSHVASVDGVVDTYIGGDNNRDDYYYDYDLDGSLKSYSIYVNPLTIDMAGTGVDGDPYIITNYNQLKQVSYNLSGHYLLNSDVDLFGKKPFILSTQSNKFTGVFDGRAHSIRNGVFYGADNVGLFGFNSGTIKGLILDNINSIGINNVGLLAGKNNGEITGSIVNGSVAGVDNLGLAVGNVTSSFSSSIEVLASGDVDGSGNNVGGVVGTLNGSGSLKTAYLGGDNVISVYGSKSNSSSVYYVSPSNTLSVDRINHVLSVDSVLDTYIGGDNNNDKYYYDYGSNGSITVFSSILNPLSVTMNGNGDSAPYEVTNASELKQVAYNPSLKYVLKSNIDLSGMGEIVLASKTNGFTGVFDGNGYTISNGQVDGINNVGLFGYNSGTIKGLRLSYMSSVGNNYVGVLVGRNEGIIDTVIIHGNSTGASYVGIVAGISGKVGENITAKVNAVASGEVLGTGDAIGGVVGSITGGNSSSLVSAFINGSVVGNSASSIGKVYGDYSNSSYKSSVSLDTSTVNNTATSSSSLSSNTGMTYSSSQLATDNPYINAGFNFSDTTKPYKWYMDNGSISFVKN